MSGLSGARAATPGLRGPDPMGIEVLARDLRQDLEARQSVTRLGINTTAGGDPSSLRNRIVTFMNSFMAGPIGVITRGLVAGNLLSSGRSEVQRDSVPSVDMSEDPTLEDLNGDDFMLNVLLGTDNDTIHRFPSNEGKFFLTDETLDHALSVEGSGSIITRERRSSEPFDGSVTEALKMHSETLRELGEDEYVYHITKCPYSRGSAENLVVERRSSFKHNGRTFTILHYNRKQQNLREYMIGKVTAYKTSNIFRKLTAFIPLDKDPYVLFSRFTLFMSDLMERPKLMRLVYKVTSVLTESFVYIGLCFLAITLKVIVAAVATLVVGVVAARVFYVRATHDGALSGKSFIWEVIKGGLKTFGICAVSYAAFPAIVYGLALYIVIITIPVAFYKSARESFLECHTPTTN